MSTEKIYNEAPNPSTVIAPEADKGNFSGTVDINLLLARVRSKKQEENKINLIFFGLFAALLLIVGILLSL